MALWPWPVRSLGKMHTGVSIVDRFEICYRVELVASSLREMGKILKTSLEQSERATKYRPLGQVLGFHLFLNTRTSKQHAFTLSIRDI